MAGWITILVVAGIFYVCSDENKKASAIAGGLIAGVPLGGLVDSLVAGHSPTWMLFLCAVCFYVGVSMNKK